MLDDTQIRQFSEQGYLVVENVIEDELLAKVHAEYTTRMDEVYVSWHKQGLVRKQPGDLSFWEKLDHCRECDIDWFQYFDISLPADGISEQTPFHFGPATFDLVRHPKILDIVGSLIGPEITSNPIQHVRIKPSQREVASDENRAHITYTAWHQDRGVGHAESDDTELVTVWLAVTDATLENGCLQVMPGPHKEMLPHCPKGQTAIADGFIDEAKAVPLPVKAGGVVLFHPLTPHSSLENNSDGYRWSFDLRYNVTGQHTGRAHFPDFVVRSAQNPELEMRDWQQWQALWEETRSRVAHSPHIEQHRWQSTDPFCA